MEKINGETMDTIIHLYFIRNHINDVLQDLFNQLYTISIKTIANTTENF